MKIDKDELRHECTLIGLNEVYTDLVVSGKLNIDLAKQFQSEDEDFCCSGEGCNHCIPF